MGHRVLLIDDDELVRKTLRRALEDADFEVVEAADGDEGIRSYETEPIDVVVTDILMPEKEGVETIMELRRKNPEVKIVAISGGEIRGGQQYLRIAGLLGADRVLPKPIRPKALLEAVRDLLPHD
jgi:DNA-binding NarL/FixJ family response regulator